MHISEQIFSANKNETNIEKKKPYTGRYYWLNSHLTDSRLKTALIHGNQSVILTAILQGASYWLPCREVSIPVAQVSSISYR